MTALRLSDGSSIDGLKLLAWNGLSDAAWQRIRCIICALLVTAPSVAAELIGDLERLYLRKRQRTRNCVEALRSRRSWGGREIVWPVCDLLGTVVPGGR